MRTLSCMTAAGFFSVLLVPTVALGADQSRVLVQAERIDPQLQRKVFYGDLNLAQTRDQRTLHRRISRTAYKLCFDLNGVEEQVCPNSAIRSTKGQVAEAIARAELRMAGRPAGPDVAITMAIASR